MTGKKHLLRLVFGVAGVTSLLLLLVPPATWCQTTPEAAPPRPVEQITYDISPYVQHVTSDAASILWESSAPTRGTVWYGLKDADDGAGTFVVEAVDVSHHELRLERLKPATIYHYRVALDAGAIRDKARWKVGHFRTAPRPGTPQASKIRFVVYGDNQNKRDETCAGHRKIVTVIRKLQPEFVIHMGDLISQDGLKAWGKWWFEPTAPLVRNTPIFPCWGNTEVSHQKENWRRIFALPGNETWYEFTWGNARFIALYSFGKTREQTAFLEKTLADAAKKDQFVFVYFHVPPYSSGPYGRRQEGKRYWKTWCPLLEKYKVTAVFHGHEHCYEHAVVNGVHYVITGGGGAGLRDVGKSDFTVYSEKTLNCVLVTIDGDVAELTAYRGDGSKMETFVVRKSRKQRAVDPSDMPVVGWKDGKFYDAYKRLVPGRIGPARVMLMSDYLRKPLPAHPPVDRFAVMGDTKSYSTVISPWFADIVDGMNKANVKTALHLGDAIPVGGSARPEWGEKKWREYFDSAAARFNGRFHLVVGNHDCGTDAGEGPYLKRARKFFYSLDFGKIHVAVLNNAYDKSRPEGERDTGIVSDEQIAWLTNDLSQARRADKRLFVVAHNPTWTRRGKTDKRGKNWREKVHPIIVANKVKAVFGGSAHVFGYHSIDGVDYFVSGGGGARFSRRLWGYSFHHFLIIDASNPEPSYTIINLHEPADR